MVKWRAEDQQRRPKKLVPHKFLQRLQPRRNDIGLLFLSGHMITLLATGALVYQAKGTGWWYLAIFLHGVVIVHLFAPFHEPTHKTAFASQKLNTLIAGFSGLIIMIPPHYFTMEHAAHHTYTQHPEKDPESIPMSGFFWGYSGLINNITYHASETSLPL